jgi:hypothetical protein
MACVVGRLRKVVDIDARERNEMFALMNRHFENVSRRQFDADLSEKQWAIQVIDSATDRIHGFSTQRLIDHAFDGRWIQALFSGDTIVDPDLWGCNILAQVWSQFVLSLLEADHDRELYWFLITNSFRTYRYLPVYFHEFYPTYREPTPDWAARLIDALAAQRYPTAYDSAAGIVRGHLWEGCRPRIDIAGVTPQRLRDQHVEFFAERNPEYGRGDELCCIARLTIENITPAARRLVALRPELEFAEV